MLRRILLLMVALAAAALSLNCRQEDGFFCGVGLEEAPESIRQCDRPHEVCVCASNSCAQRVATSDCESGLRYVESPYVREGLAHQCVDPAEREWLVEEDATVFQCSTKRPPDAGVSDDPGDAGP